MKISKEELLYNLNKWYCSWCNELYDVSELKETSLEGCYCDYCIQEIKSHNGDKSIKVYGSISEEEIENLNDYKDKSNELEVSENE